MKTFIESKIGDNILLHKPRTMFREYPVYENYEKDEKDDIEHLGIHFCEFSGFYIIYGTTLYDSHEEFGSYKEALELLLIYLKNK